MEHLTSKAFEELAIQVRRIVGTSVQTIIDEIDTNQCPHCFGLAICEGLASIFAIHAASTIKVSGRPHQRELGAMIDGLRLIIEAELETLRQFEAKRSLKRETVH